MAKRLRDLGRDVLVYGVLDVANRFATLLLLPVYTRVFLPADFGRLDLAWTLTTVAVAAFMLGLDQALLYRFNATDDPAERRRLVSSATAVCFGAMSAGAALMVLGSSPLAGVLLPDVPGNTRLLVLVAATLPLQGVNQIHMLLLRVRRDFRRYTALSLGGLVLSVGLTVYFLFGLGLGVEGVLLAQVVTRVPMAAYGFAVNRAEFAASVSPGMANGMVRYGAPLVLGQLSYWGLMYAERYSLAIFGSLDDVGIFGLAVRVAMLVTLVSVAIDLAWLPFAHSLQRDPEAPHTYAAGLWWYFLGAGTIGTLLAVFAREGLVLMTTPAYYQAYVLVGPIVAALVLRGAANVVAIGALVSRRTFLVSEASLLAAAVDIALLVVLVPVFGAMGAAVATLGARVASVALLVVRTNRGYPVPYPWARIFRLSAVFALTVAAGVALSRLGLWTGFALKVGVLLPAMVLALVGTGVVRRGEMNAVLAVLPRVPYGGALWRMRRRD
jgi:O-antigen/teichoic acid export membrane protein